MSVPETSSDNQNSDTPTSGALWNIAKIAHRL